MKSAVPAALVVLVLPLVAIPLLASAYAKDQSQQTCGSEAACPDVSTLGTAAPFAGAGGGCTVPDPSGTGGCVTPAMAWLTQQVEHRFGHLPVSCWSARGGDPYSDHPKGRACDYAFGRIGTYPGAADVQRGWALATWLRANAVPLHVNYVIWQGRIWSRANDAEGWRPYTGGGHYSVAGPTNSHSDHVHISTLQTKLQPGVCGLLSHDISTGIQQLQSEIE